MGMATDQVDGGCEQARASAGCLHPDLLVLAVQEVIRTVPNKLSQGVAWKEEEGCLNTGLQSITTLTREQEFKEHTPRIFLLLVLFSDARVVYIPYAPASASLCILPSNSKLPSVRRARVMLPTSLASGMLVRLGEASWWARPFGMPGCRRGLCIRTRESILSSPSWISFFSCGIWRLKSYSTAVRAGLRARSKQKSLEKKQ